MNNRQIQKKKILNVLVFIIVIILFSIITVVFFGFRVLGLSYYKDLKKIAEQYNVDPKLVMAICKTESSFRSDAISHSGAVGIMQVMPKTAEWIAEINKFDYEYDYLFEMDYNAKIGCLYLVYLQKKFSFEWTIVAYNAGENMASRWIKNNISFDNIPYPETRNYLKKVLSNYNFYKVLLGNR